MTRKKGRGKGAGKLKLDKRSVRRIDNSDLERVKGGLVAGDINDSGACEASGDTNCNTDLCAQYTDTNLSCNFKNNSLTCCAITMVFTNHNQALRRR